MGSFLTHFLDMSIKENSSLLLTLVLTLKKSFAFSLFLSICICSFCQHFIPCSFRWTSPLLPLNQFLIYCSHNLYCYKGSIKYCQHRIYLGENGWRLQKQPSRGVLRKKYSENMQQSYRRTPMPKCDLWLGGCFCII